MKESTIAIEEVMDFDKSVAGSADLSKYQRNYIVSRFIEEDPTEELIENIVYKHVPKDISRLISKLYSCKDDDKEKLVEIAKKLKKVTHASLDDHYDDEIDNVISDVLWSRTEESLQKMSSSNRHVAMIENETPYGAALTL